MADLSSSPDLTVRLSVRQRECLRLAALGYTAVQSARRLGISPRTVREHLFAARQKLGASSTTQAVHIAQQKGLLEIAP